MDWKVLSKAERKEYLFKWFLSELNEEGEINVSSIVSKYPEVKQHIPEVTKDVAEFLFKSVEDISTKIRY